MLLAEDRSAEQFEALLAQGRGEDAVAPEDVRRLHALALRVLRLRDLGRRRESELSALFDTVADLAALKDLDDVLEAIVRRARTLLACDVSYLSLNDDEAGETYMRITQGIHTEEFRHVRLGFGEGLGGLVAQTARPYATADYFADERFDHTRSIDSAVRGEELRAILGVPLLLGRTVIGVLYAANHDARPFSREDVDLLTSFAAHAAVALDNARRSDQMQAAVTELEETGALLRSNVQSVERAADAHDRLAGVVLRGGTLHDVAGELQDVLQAAVAVVDDQGATLATSEPGAPPTAAELVLVTQVLADNCTHVGDGLSVAPVWADGAPITAVLLRAEVDESSRRILERAAQTAALLMVVQRSAEESRSRLRGDLLLDLVVGRVGAGSLTARATLLGTDLARDHVVLVVDGADGHAGQVADQLAVSAGGLCAPVGERLVLALPGEDPLAAGRRLVGRFAGSGVGERPVGRARPTIGAAGPVTGVDGVRTAHREAVRCLEALLAMGRRGDVADPASLGFVGLLLGRGDPAEHVRTQLGPVLDYDDRRGTALVETLEAWLAEDRHLARTGERLLVHPNTVTQRLERVTSLLGEGWQEPGRLLEVALALRLLAILPAR
ncbi:GAF domain-containing protein [Ornithinimicrobium avium]|uniref:GAF domain-containing protein n=2 Tax=Ornithinimicrobium avium TaxID=2283195 RepID=A0A345NS96_9MICO|nr:GAF domain-containing protein [Ornithinimicrobium avium]